MIPTANNKFGIPELIISIVVILILFWGLISFLTNSSKIYAQSTPVPTVTVTVTPSATPEENNYTAKDFADKAIIGENKSFAIIPLDLNNDCVNSGSEENRKFIIQILNEFCKKHHVRLASLSVIPRCNVGIINANALAVTFYPEKTEAK